MMQTAYEQALARVGSDRALLRQMYELMLLSREIDRVAGAADAHWHACTGEEAVLAACYCGWRETDWVAPHYRGMVPAAVARGADLRRLFAGFTGKATSHSGGRYRSDVCAPVEFKLIGLYSGALGPSLEYAAGTALAAKLDESDALAIAVFGDGTSSRGNVHEALNLAAVLALPVIYVCQNNQLAISTPVQRGVGARSVADRGAAYGMPGVAADGNDAVALRAAVEVAAARARAGEGPTLIEALTYRVAGHLVADPAAYRSGAEVEAWRGRDPVPRLRAHLLDRAMLSEAEDDSGRAALAARADAAMAQALADPDPGPEALAAGEVFARSPA
jgi:TPP-dependent pyruvate/acetoin dehydrogenase alpha subunit